MKSCENCVNHKVHFYRNGEEGWHSLCSGVTWHTGESKRSEWLDDLTVADECLFYDESSWAK